MKVCTKCQLNKNLTDFYFNSSRNNYKSVCKICERAYKKKIRATPKHKEYIRVYNKKWREQNKEKLALWNETKERSNRIRRTYGITEEQYNNLSEIQNHCCAICKTHKNELPKPLYVDHCHDTGTIRGLLCQKCNSGIGLLKDSIEILENAVSYLKK